MARVGLTRFVSRMMNRSRSGSSQIDVPVKPVWPNARRDSRVPALEYPESEGVSQPSARVEPGTTCWRRVNSAIVSARISCSVSQAPPFSSSAAKRDRSRAFENSPALPDTPPSRAALSSWTSPTSRR